MRKKQAGEVIETIGDIPNIHYNQLVERFNYGLYELLYALSERGIIKVTEEPTNQKGLRGIERSSFTFIQTNAGDLKKKLKGVFDYWRLGEI